MYNDNYVVLLANMGCGDGFMGSRAIRNVFKTTNQVLYSGAPADVELADLIILPGGADVDYVRYGGDKKLCGYPSMSLEIFDAEVLPYALEQRIPIFGICRGIQTLWVQLGGKLEEHISGRHRKIGTGWGHEVDGAWGEHTVNSLHHQAPMYPAPPDVTVTMHAPDGTIEGMIYQDFAVAVQWHPEMMPYYKWGHLIEAALKRDIQTIGEKNE